MMPMSVVLDDDERADEDFDVDPELLGGEKESRFYTCHVCGDNWLTVKETTPGGTCRITFVHQMGTEPQLKRVAHMQTPVLVNEDTVDEWEYFLGENTVGENDWYERLSDRRDVLKAICVN